MYADQIEQGQKYDVLKKCVSIRILDFELFKKGVGFYSCFHIREDTSGFLYTDKMEFHVIELPKLPLELTEDCAGIELWAKFINAERKEEFDMIVGRDPYIDSAYQQLQVISQDKQKRMEYEAREKAVRDYNQGMYEAEERGRKEGRKEVIQMFIEMGWEYGLDDTGILKRLQEKAGLSPEEATAYLKEYGSQLT